MKNILLVCPEKENGLSHHRLLAPHSLLQHQFPGEYNLSRTASYSTDMTGYDVVYFQRHIGDEPTTKGVIEGAKKQGAKVFFDIDDTWELTSTHPMYSKYKEGKVDKTTPLAVKMADYVTTTTPYFADKLRKINPNTHVLPNALFYQTWKPRQIDSTLTRFGWIGGLYHSEDIEMMRHGIASTHYAKTLKGKFQFCLGGFNPNEFYLKTEKVFTDNYSTLDENYKMYLSTCTQSMEHYSFHQPYRRLWGRSVHDYQELYNDIDVALIPLKSNSFSICKSEIKAIEAGFMKKAVIVSDTIPYTYICNQKNSILVQESRKHKDWGRAINRLINEPNLRNDLAEALHEEVTERYDLLRINELRHQLYNGL